jgi:LysR family transcriptional activator of nhaA
MEWLNYHHLYYFWTVAREGSIARASQVLHLTPPTISTQLRQLELMLGEPLFRRTGRQLVLTDVGRTVADYAEEIFSLGRELLSAVRQRPTGQPLRLTVGISDAVPKIVVRELLRPAFALEPAVRIVCREGDVARLLAELATFRLDVVLSEQPAPESARVRTFDHRLGESATTFFAAPRLARRLRRGFPKSLHEAPALLPTRNTAMRRNLDSWFERLGVRPRIVAEFEDTALLLAYAADELGFFALPSVAAEEVARRYGAQRIGVSQECRERFFAISAERKLKHPAVLAITEAARSALFAAPGA